MIKKQKLVIAVTALNAIDSQGPGVGVIRAIRECKDFEVRIIGLAYESLEPGIYMHDIVTRHIRFHILQPELTLFMPEFCI